MTDIVGAGRLQMVRHQVVGDIKPFVANRANDFADIVRKSSLPDGARRLLHGINRREAWLPVTIDGAEVSDDIRGLARGTLRHVLSRHRKPTLSRIGRVVDQHAATLAESKAATEFPLWLRLSGLDKGKRIEIPLKSYPCFEARRGKRPPTVQVNQDKDDGRLTAGVITDISEACEAANLDISNASSLACSFGLVAVDFAGFRRRTRRNWRAPVRGSRNASPQSRALPL